MIGIIPSVNRNEGFFNDNDREILKSVGKEIAKGTLENIYDEQFNIYKVFTLAEEKLYLSYSSSNNAGNALRASVLINKLKRVFPKLEEKSNILKQETEIINETSTFEELLKNIKKNNDGEKVDEVWQEVFEWYNNNEHWKPRLQYALSGLQDNYEAETITKENIEKLYGKTLQMSVSKLEQFQKCPYSFYLTYGLKLKEVEEFKIKSLDTGSFMHDVVATFFAQEMDIKQITDEEINISVNNIVNEKLNLNKNFIFKSSSKFIVLTNILKTAIYESIKYIVEQMKNSDFKILGNEVEFNQKFDNIEITGKIDRIDVAKNEDGEYIRIVDYKSSTQGINLNEVMAGTRIQLLTYMDVFSTKYKKMPAGILYYNLIQPIVKKEKKLTEEEIKQEIRKSFRMNGLVLADIKVIKMMDNSLKNGISATVPAEIKQNGELSKNSNTLTKEDFSNLQKRIKRLIIKISAEIAKGKIDINPVYNKKDSTSACQYCKYNIICRFDKNNGKYSFIQNKGKEEILNEIKEE